MQKDYPDSFDNLPDQSSKNDFSTAESSTAPLPPSDVPLLQQFLLHLLHQQHWHTIHLRRIWM